MASRQTASGNVRNPPQGGKGTRATPPRRSKERPAQPSVISTTAQDEDQPAEQRSFSPEQWQEMVATAAYYRAERRGFEPGSPLDDWFEAESELRRAHGIE